MANPTVTYTFVNGNVADASQVNQNFTDIINGLTDGTKSLNIDALTCAGAFTANGSVDLGNAASDTISMTGYVDTNLTIKSTDAGATAGPDIIIDRDSASAADSDAIGRIIFRGNDDAGTPADNDYASIEATIVDSGAGSEDGNLKFKVSRGGTSTTVLDFSGDGFTVNVASTSTISIDQYRIIYMPNIYNTSLSGSMRAVYTQQTDGAMGYNPSVRAAKTNIDYTCDTNWIYELNPVSFNYRKKEKNGAYQDTFHEETQYGLIAEDVEMVNDNLVFYNYDGDKKILAGVHYDRLIAPLINELKNLKNQIDDLKSKI